MTIDWNAPLEAYHPDGRVVEVTPDDEDWPSSDGMYWVEELTGWFKPDGTPLNECDPWRIRNRTEKPDPQYPVELVEALRRAEMKLTAYVGVCSGDKELTEAVLPMVRKALADLPQPVDPDLELARNAAASVRPHSHNSALIMEGCRDETDIVQAALAAIKRIRTQTQDVRDGKGS